MNEFLLRDIKLSIQIKSGDRFNQLLCQIHQDPNYRASIALFAPLKISLREKEYLKEKLQDVVEDFAIETCVIHVVSLKTEQHRGLFEFLAQLEFSPDINHMLEAFDSVLADHKGIKEQKVQKLIPEIKIYSSSQLKIVEQVSRYFTVSQVIKGDRLVLTEKLGSLEWVESAEIARFLF